MNISSALRMRIKVTLNGKTVVEKDLAPDDQNALAKYADAFEDGFNRVENRRGMVRSPPASVSAGPLTTKARAFPVSKTAEM